MDNLVLNTNSVLQFIISVRRVFKEKQQTFVSCFYLFIVNSGCYFAWSKFTFVTYPRCWCAFYNNL